LICCAGNNNTVRLRRAAWETESGKQRKARLTAFLKKEDAVRDQLEALILQMYKSNILYSEAVREFKKRFILTVLQENNGNQCRAARQLGMHRNTLSRTISELKIDIRQLRAGVKRPPRSARPAAYDKKIVR
jgi:DNA-binding NtrC family response regulator